jgi:PleD family two-component response regulator
MREIVSAQPVEASLGLTSVTISMGIAHTSGLEPVTTAELISLADKKLYEAKHAGRDCVCA